MTGILALATVTFVTASTLQADTSLYRQHTDIERVFIGFHNTPGESGRALVRAFGGEVRYEYSSVPVVVARMPQAAISALERHPHVAYIHPDMQVEAMNTSVKEVKEVNNTWGVRRIGADVVHNPGVEDVITAASGTSVKIGIIDSGIQYTHPELQDAYVGGYDFFYFDEDPMDVYGHGTHVAGTACATYNDNAYQLDGAPLYGVVGVAPACELYSLRVLNEDGVGYWSDIAAAVEWATGATVWLEPWASGDVPGQYATGTKLDVVNLSLGKTGYPGEAVETIFKTAYDSGLLIVAAAGNSGNRGGNNDTIIYPAKFDSVIAVGATNNTDQRATFSSTGPTLELTAPGVEVYSTWNNSTAYYGTPNCRGDMATHDLGEGHEKTYSSIKEVETGDCYKFGSGTSMASPHVAGVAALILSVNPALSAQEVRIILRETAEPLGDANQYGSGLVSAVEAVRLATVLGEDNSTGEGDGGNDDGNGGDGDGTGGDDEQITTGDMTISAIEYTASGGRFNDRHLTTTITATNGDEYVSGASVTYILTNNGLSWNGSGTTGSDGALSFTVSNAPSGCYFTKIESVSHENFVWDTNFRHVVYPHKVEAETCSESE